jgi:uncharacterized heparinase superfamily protein
VTSQVFRAGLLIRTAAHLRPAQVVHRARLRGQKAALQRWGDPITRRLARPTHVSWGWPESFEPLDARLMGGSPSPEANASGTFQFLAQTRHLGDPPTWDSGQGDQLWRYHLHYWEWAWPFAALDDRAWAQTAFARLWRSWKTGTTVGRWEAWSPYVVSLRAWVMCGVHRALVAGAEWEASFIDDVAVHAGFLAANLEQDVGGNHLIKNLKALVGTGVFLRDDRLVTRASGLLARQLNIQVLGDGGHFERSPSYHCQVLGDLIDIAQLLGAAEAPPVDGLEDKVAGMRSWLGTMLLPDGEVPLLKDCTTVGSERLAMLAPAPSPSEPLTVLETSGYAVIRLGRWHLVADVGRPCAPHLPAHAHADTLSFVMMIDGRAVVVDTGTSEYGTGPRRHYERSTAAHNTVEVDGVDSTEVWGAFRAGRRARPCLERAQASDAEVLLTASHDGYRFLAGRPLHRRTWRVTEGEVTITDDVCGGGEHTAIARLHIAGDASMLERAQVTGGVAKVVGPGGWQCGLVARDFGVLVPAACLEVTASGRLPLRLSITLPSDDEHPPIPLGD